MWESSASFGNVKISDLDFTHDAVIFTETLDIPLGALEVLNEESEPLGLRASWVKTKIQAFSDILDAALLSVPICGEDAEVVERYSCLCWLRARGQEMSGSGPGSHGFTGS